MVDNNFTRKGRTVPDYPGAIIANHSYQVTAEWAYGVTPWFEQGLYMPVTSPYSSNYGSTINGFKIRELFARPNAHDHKFFYAANFEFSVNHSYWESRTITSRSGLSWVCTCINGISSTTDCRHGLYRGLGNLRY